MFALNTRFTLERLDNRDLMSATFAFGWQPEPVATHVLYQDITIPTNQSAGTATFVGVSDPTDDSNGPVVTINEINGVPAPQGKAVLYGRKSGDDKRQD